MEFSTFLTMLNKTIDTANGAKQQDIHFKKLQRLFLLECQCNMKLLDTTKWKGVTDEFKKEILKNLKTDAAQAIHCFVEQDNISWLSEKMNNATKKYLSFDSEEEQDENVSKLMSLVSRIETLKVLSNLSSEFQEENVARYDTRISNLRKLIAEIIKQHA